MTSHQIQKRVAQLALNISAQDAEGFPNLSLTESFNGSYGSNFSSQSVRNDAANENIKELINNLMLIAPICKPFQEDLELVNILENTSNRKRRSVSRHSPSPKRVKAELQPARITTSPSLEPVKTEIKSDKPIIVPRPPPQQEALHSAVYYEELGSAYNDDANELKHKADDLKGASEKIEMYLKACLVYLRSLHYKELAIEAYRREKNDTERKKITDVVRNIYQATAKFISQCKPLSRCTDTTSFLNICEAVALYRGFRLWQDRTAGNLHLWLKHVKSGKTLVTAEHEQVILKPLNDMMHSLTAWRRASDLQPSRFPEGCFTTITVNDLESFWNSR